MNRLFALLSAGLIAGITVLAFVLTRAPSQTDPCLTPQNDISAATLADEGDQAALANRAMLQRTLCEEREPRAPDR